MFCVERGTIMNWARWVNNQYIFFLAVFVLNIVNIFLKIEWLTILIGYLALVMLIVSFPLASRLFKTIGGGFLLVGAFLFPSTGFSVLEIPKFLANNLSLLALIAMLPWMNSVVKTGKFDQLLHSLLGANVKHLGQLYPRSTTTMLTLTGFLNLSSASISQEVLMDNLKKINQKVSNKFIMMTTLRGYSLALLWSPLEILLVVSIFTTGVSYLEFLPWAIIISVIMFSLDALWGYFYFKKHPYETEEVSHSIEGKALRKKLIHFISALVLFLTSVVLASNLFNLEFILAVTLIIFPFCYIWALILKKGKTFRLIGWDNWKEKTNKMQNFIVLFISLAFFSNSLNASPTLQIIQQPILMVQDYPIVIFIFIQFLFVFLSMFGVHPLATMGILAGISGTLMEIVSPMSLAIILATSSIATIPVGTYGLVVTLTSMNLKQSPYLITLYNLPYSFVFGVVGITFAYFLI